ncbi:SGNH/GDSL hydrolase family protein [Cohnella sp. GCM10012308]|uniref:SGNH/GDSL hydrolase family protein n=1 Tax=Cohnella sp. GCM10012308 TaxID=3317329 RepID=UPI003619847A
MQNARQSRKPVDGAFAVDSLAGGPWRWLDAEDASFRKCGLPWFDSEKRFRRLPLAPAWPIRPEIDRLANFPTGAQIRFRTNSAKLAVRVRLFGRAEYAQLSPIAQCGIDCYLGPQGSQRYVCSTKFHYDDEAYESLLFENQDASEKEVTLYLPLYQGIHSLEIGLAPDATAAPFTGFASDKKVVIYGTSIVHGAGASRPGMAYPNQLSRRLPIEFVSLAFSGNAQGEPELASLATEIDEPALLVLDYEGNTPSTERLGETLPAFISIYREVHPATPILVVSQIRMGREAFVPLFDTERRRRLTLQRDIVQRLRDAGDTQVFFLSGEDMLGEDYGECSADSVHPSDLGYARMRDCLLPAFASLLKPDLK